jgi:hypothetical protein
VLSEMSSRRHDLDVGDLTAGAVARTARFVLREATAETQCQAFAHAVGMWWADVDTGVRYTTDGRIPLARVRVETYGDPVGPDRQREASVVRLMGPWIDGERSAVTYDGDRRQWIASLDGAGHARLVELLGVFERREPTCPSDLGDPAAIDPDRRSGAEISATSLDELLARLADGFRCSVSASSDLVMPPQLPVVGRGTRCADALATLRASGIPVASVRGVLCLGRQAIDREHPAQRRRLAVIPIAHLVHDAVESELLAARLERSVFPPAWDRPGYGLVLIAPGTLLVSADTVVIAGVLDALARIDTLGFAEGIETLLPATGTSP